MVPFFSVVVPVFNRSGTIGKCLQSVKDQTWTDFECLVIDDGSKDGDQLSAVVASLADPRFRYIRIENGGASRARNIGFDLAKAPYIALLDSDDLFTPNKLSYCADVISDADDDIIIYSRLTVDRGVGRTWLKPRRGISPSERVDEYLMCTSGWIQSSTIVLSTAKARAVRFDENLPSSQDTDFAIRVTNAGAALYFVEEPLVILNDVFDNNRVSKQKNYAPLLEWIERMRYTHVSERAYWAYRGWQCARVASYSDRLRGLALFLQSARRGVYPPRQCAVVAAQVLLPPWAYQGIVNKVVRLFGHRFPSIEH